MVKDTTDKDETTKERCTMVRELIKVTELRKRWFSTLLLRYFPLLTPNPPKIWMRTLLQLNILTAEYE
jgi:hypothetical protein